MLRLSRLIAIAMMILLAVSCSKKQELKPRGEDFDPEKSFSTASALLKDKKYDDARARFLEIKARDNTLKYAPMAQLRIADSYIEQENPDAAIEEYNLFLNLYPRHKYASYALYQKAMIFFNQIESPERGYGAAKKALDEFMKLKERYPRNPYTDVVDLKIDYCINIIADYEFLVGEFYLDKKAYHGALDRFTGIIMNLPEYRNIDKVFFNMAMAYKGLGDSPNAEKYFSMVMENYPDTDLAKSAREQIASLKKVK